MADWLGRMLDRRLYAYRLPAEAFRPHEDGGYWVADEPVDVTERVVIDDLLGRHAIAGLELRITPSVWPFWQRITNSTSSSAAPGFATRIRTGSGSVPRSKAERHRHGGEPIGDQGHQRRGEAARREQIRPAVPVALPPGA